MSIFKNVHRERYLWKNLNLGTISSLVNVKSLEKFKFREILIFKNVNLILDKFRFWKKFIFEKMFIFKNVDFENVNFEIATFMYLNQDLKISIFESV